ncbi:MAG: hypothetical protein BWK73_07835 [Thiothrix lacustris]|uniref:Uncharacterized protein n=1 Tax=Thiothrix lacustris TaxID=525917 RepID=A0A1Y1QWS2_9GAMM|nr:MAG: hypothetical protein BWK73_07835 [Thiothrix lacustris]
MTMISPRTLACMAILLGSLSLPACSTLTVNPFKQQTDVETPAPAATSIRVETKPPEPKERQQEVEVNVGDNKQCTTFCALPMRQPPAN